MLKKKYGENFLSPILSWTKCFQSPTLSWTKNFLSPTLSWTRNFLSPNFVSKGNIFHHLSIKHDILRLFAKKNFGENVPSPTLSWTKNVLSPTLSWTRNFLSPKVFQMEYLFHHFSIKHDILRLLAK